MIGKIFGIGVLGLTLNKIVYGLLLRSPKKKRQELYGEGEIRVISHNALGKSWVSPMKVSDLQVQPMFQMNYLHDILLTKQEKGLFAFRPRAYHENLNMALSTKGLSSLEYSQYSSLLASFSDLISNQAIIRLNLWTEDQDHSISFSIFKPNPLISVKLHLLPASENFFNSLHFTNFRFHNNLILDGEKSNIFFVLDNGKILTPISEHSAISLFNVQYSVGKDTIIKLLNVNEEFVNVEVRENCVGAFIMCDGLGVVPVESISFQGEEIRLGMEKTREIQEKVGKVMVRARQLGDYVKTLCQDKYTEEVWSERLKLLD